MSGYKHNAMIIKTQIVNIAFIKFTAYAKHSNSFSSNTISTGKGCPITTKGRPNHSHLYLMLQVFKTLRRKFHIVRG